MKGATWVGALAWLLCASVAHAEPQWNAGLLTGVCGRGLEDQYWQDTCWYNALRGDVLLGRSRNSDFGVGPFVQVGTAGFDDVRFSAGPSVLIPWDSFLPIVVSGGGMARRDDDQWYPAVMGSLFIGSRSYNFHSNYAIATGLSVGFSRGVGDFQDNTIIIAVQLDGVLLALPFLLGYSALSGPPEGS